jgi:ADP-ribose pyrophosphatase YjhB (NUDIX family)
MHTRPSKREDALQAAARIVRQTTGQEAPRLNQTPAITEEEKRLRSQAASILGKLGGSKGGKMRAASLSQERRREIAQKAAAKRWGKT